MKRPSYYQVRWFGERTHVTLGSVSCFAQSDTEAKAKADRIGLEIGLDRACREIHNDYRLVEDRPFQFQS